MKLVLLFFVLCTTLSNVYSFHKKYNEGQSVSYQERTVSQPVNVYLEYKHQDPVYTLSSKPSEPVQHAHSFDIFSILKNKFGKFGSIKPRLFHPTVQYAEPPKCVCPQVPNYPPPVPAPKPIVFPTPTDPRPQFYVIPLQDQSSGKTNFFSKIKSHFHGGELGASGATLKIVSQDPYVQHGRQLIDNQYVNSPSEVDEVYARNSNPNVAVTVEEQTPKPQ